MSYERGVVKAIGVIEERGPYVLSDAERREWERIENAYDEWCWSGGEGQ